MSPFFIFLRDIELISISPIIGSSKPAEKLFFIPMRKIVTHFPSPYFYFPLAQQILSQADIGSWPANLLEKEFVVHSIAGYRTYFDIPSPLKGFGFKIFGIGHGGDIRTASGGEDNKKAVFLGIFGSTSRLFIFGFTEKSDTTVENFISMF